MQEISVSPFSLMFFNELSIIHYANYRSGKKKCILHIDATGGVVKVKDLTGKAPFYYALTFKPSDIVSKKDAKENELSAFSYANYITTNNKTCSVTSFLMTFLQKFKNIQIRH